jgi:hypothetical protein
VVALSAAADAYHRQMVAILGGILFVALGFWRLLLGLAYFGVIGVAVPDVPDSPLFRRLPGVMKEDRSMHAVRDCICGPIFVAGGVIAVISGFS